MILYYLRVGVGKLKKYINENKNLILQYLYIIISNILVTILVNYYFKNFIYKDILLLGLVLIFDMVIYYYKGKNRFVFYLDLLVNIFVGLLILVSTNKLIDYSTILLSLFLANNIVYVRSRLSDSFIKMTLQYFLVLVYTILGMILNIIIFYFIR